MADKFIQMPTHSLTPDIVEAAIYGLEAQKQQIDAKIAELRALTHGHTAPAPAKQAKPGKPAKTKGKRAPMSAEGRARIAAAQRERWAALKKGGTAKAAKPKAKRKLSAAGRKAISEAAKRFWAAKRAAKG
jgi:hypothetical protein